MQQQQYKVNNKIFDSIESAGEYMLTLKHILINEYKRVLRN